MTNFCRTALLGLLTVSGARAQSAVLREAPPVQLPIPVDSNTPSFWWNGELRMFSSAGDPQLYGAQEAMAEVGLHGVPTPAWIESVWLDRDGTLFAWYHHEVTDVCPGTTLTVPKIGAAVSWDGGETLQDLGFVLESPEPADCSSENGYFAGGHGDFSVAFDEASGYFYFLYSNYGGAPAEQGIAMARLAYADRWAQAGSVWKYSRGSWQEPGLRGHATAVFPATASWQQPDTDSFWGPSVHWNTYLERFVVVMNRSCCEPGWPQKGIYLTMTADIADPAAWFEPVRLFEGGDWYPQILGSGAGETGSLAGQLVRLFTGAISNWELLFEREEVTGRQPRLRLQRR